MSVQVPHVPATAVPERLPGEPPLPDAGPGAIAAALVGQALLLGLLSVVVFPWWVVYLVARRFRPRPPNLASLRRTLHVLRLILTEQPPAPGLSVPARSLLLLSVLKRWLLVPVWGLAWYLDELWFGRALAQVAIVAPLFELSAARSGSTQLARYLEDDPHIVAPTCLQVMFPFLWLWQMAPATLGRLLSPDRVRVLMAQQFPPDWIQRHELDPFRTDTFEIMFLYFQFGDISLCLGPRVAVADMGTARISPDNHQMWEQDFLDFIGCIGRKALLHAKDQRSTRPLRLMIKGHFLHVAPALERRYPDARFLTVVRAPAKRIQSVINFLRAQPRAAGLSPTPWSWIIQAALETEPDYCELERAWLQRPGGARRTVVRFDDYVADLEGTMRRVYRTCLDTDELPAGAPRTHAPRERTHYAVDRSLKQLNIDPAWLELRLDAYLKWCRSLTPHRLKQG